MTVADLKKILDNYDDETLIVLSGHSDGDNDDFFTASNTEEVSVELKKYSWRGNAVRSNNNKGTDALFIY